MIPIIEKLVTRAETDRSWRERYWWPAVFLIALIAYLYHLDSLHIVNIGDEAPYLQITRLTAAAGHWLPLQGEAGMRNTKPPMLFWQGIVSTNWAQAWTLWRLRLPIVLYTFVVAGLVFLLACRASGTREQGWLAALSFLAFSSTLQHGRPFLTNMPETLFLFLPVFGLIFWREKYDARRLWFWLAAGLSIGIATLYRSFVLVAPMGLALAWIMFYRRAWQVKPFLLRDAPGIALALTVALLCFSLWPLLDPEPQAIWSRFVVGENVGKLQGDGYPGGLFSGPYPVWRIWLGQFTNAGLMAPILVGIVIITLRQGRSLTETEKTLWLFVLAFLVVYTLPSQRQENYLLPTVPALAVLIGLRWPQLGTTWFRLMLLPAAIGIVLVVMLGYAMARAPITGDGYGATQIAVWLVGLAALAWALLRVRTAPMLFHLICFLGFLGFAALLAPFDGPAGRFPAATAARLTGETVYVSYNFPGKYDRHRFLLPRTDIQGYWHDDTALRDRLLREGKPVALQLAYDEAPPDGYDVLGERLDLRSRLSAGELSDILIRHRIDRMVRKEVIVKATR